MVENQPPQEKAVPQPQVAPETQPAPPKPSKTPIVIMSVITALSLLLSGYLAYQNIQLKGQIEQPTAPPAPAETPDSTESWETYTNTKDNYVLKYKPNSKLKQFTCSLQNAFETGSETFILDEVDSSFPECGHGGYSWPISITLQDVSPTCDSTEDWSAKQSQITVNGITATRCDQEFVGVRLYPGSDNTSWVVVEYGAKFLNLSLTNISYEDTFNEILSTFKFVE